MAKIEDVLGKFDQSNFDVAGAAGAMRSLGAKHGLSEDDLAAAVSVFGDEHRAQFNSGYTEGSNYNAIAQRAVQDALKAKGKDPSAAADEGYIATGAAQANERWKATQKDDDGGFGQIAMMAVAAIAAAHGVPMWATALGKAGFSLASGADPGDAILNGGLSYLTGNMLSGAGVDTAGMENSFDSGAMNEVLNRGTDVVGTGDPFTFAGGVSDTGYGAGKTADIDLGGENSFDNGQMQGIVDQGPAAIPDTQSPAPWEERSRVYRAPGLVEQYMNPLVDWANQNPGASKLIGAIGGGALTMAGGVGAALLNKSAAEMKIEADRALASQKTEELLKEAQNKRAMVQGGSYFDSRIGVTAPVKTRQLRRPDGSLVFAQPGIIASEMASPG